MNNYNVYDEDYVDNESYQKFISENPSRGSLRIRAYAASEAIPIRDLKVTISKKIGDYNVIFYEGYTDESGLIERISLPTPKLSTDNLVSPSYATYLITAVYPKDNFIQTYQVNMYENICVVQNILVVPGMNIEGGTM